MTAFLIGSSIALGAMIAGVVLFYLTMLCWQETKRWRGKSHHQKMMAQAKTALRTITNAPDHSSAVRCIRATHPNAVEEVLLTACSSSGFKVHRNGDYNSFNGLDARIKLPTGVFIVRARKYLLGTSASDVIAFSKTCRDNDVRGIFITIGPNGSRLVAPAVAVFNEIDLVDALKKLPAYRQRPVPSPPPPHSRTRQASSHAQPAKSAR